MLVLVPSNLPKGLLQPYYVKEEDRNQALLNFFYAWLRATGKAEATQKSARSVLKVYQNHVSDLQNPDVFEVTNWVKNRRKNCAQNTVNRSICFIRQFYQSLIAVSVREDIPACIDNLKTKKVPKRLPRHLTDWQVGQLLAAPDLQKFTGFRDHVIIRILYETGMRAGEIRGLSTPDLRVGGLHVNGRFCPISPELERLIQAWLKLRKQANPGRQTALFITTTGRPFTSPNRIWRILDGYARKALGNAQGFGRVVRTRRQKPWTGLYPHQLRSSFAGALLASGCDIRAVQLLLGHSDPRTTERYLGLDIDHLRREHAKLFPPP